MDEQREQGTDREPGTVGSGNTRAPAPQGHTTAGPTHGAAGAPAGDAVAEAQARTAHLLTNQAGAAPSQTGGTAGSATPTLAPPSPSTPEPPTHPAGASFGLAEEYGPFAPPATTGTPARPRSVSRGVTAGIAGAALVVGLVAGGATGAVIAGSGSDTAAGTTAAESASGGAGTQQADPGTSTPDQGQDGTVPGFGPGGRGGFAPDGGTSGGSSQAQASAATAEQQVGVVTIDSTLGYQNGESAGTGMVLTSDGLVLTNNHVIAGATSIEVTVESTGKTYTATVLGADPSADVALLQLQDASGLQTVTLDDDGGVQSGDEVTAVGNAEGTGDLVAATGDVTATDQSMTASTGTGDAETLDGLIQFSADVVSGDSGGPVLDDEGEVVGITTAASTNTSSTVAYAIEIQDAVAIVHQIASGEESGTVQIGLPAFLGVALAGSSASTGVSGAVVGDVLAGTPAEKAGLAAGDVITAVDGTAVGSADDLSAALATHDPGDKVTLSWTSGSTGQSERATVTLVEGPAA